MGRPKKEISEDQVRELASINCSYAEIAAVVGCSVSTLTDRFQQTIKEGLEHGKSSLKRVMWKAAMGGNITMMIWLSKQMLGYSDKFEEDSKTRVIVTEEQKAAVREKFKVVNNDVLAKEIPS